MSPVLVGRNFSSVDILLTFTLCKCNVMTLLNNLSGTGPRRGSPRGRKACFVPNSTSTSTSFDLDLVRKAKKNPKIIWKYTNSKTKTRSGIGDLAIDPEDPKSALINDNAIKAEILSGFFSRVFTREPNDDVPCLSRMEIQQQMSPLVITENAVTKLLKKLKVDKSPGPDGMHPKYLSQIAPSIALQEYSKNR